MKHHELISQGLDAYKKKIVKKKKKKNNNEYNPIFYPILLCSVHPSQTKPSPKINAIYAQVP